MSVMRRSQSRARRPRSDLLARVMVAVPAIAFALFIVIEGHLIFALGLFVVGGVAMHELYGMFDSVHPVRLAGFLSLLGLLLAAYYGGQYDIVLAMAAAVPLLFGLTLAQRQQTMAGMAITLLGIWWIGLGLAHAVLLRDLHHGAGVVIDVLVGTFLGDTGAYFGGHLFGKRPLAPQISPHKTIEGLAIGMMCAVLAVWFASRYQDWMPGTHALVLGAGVAVAAPVGDLFESFIKRRAAIKDSGRMFGAHGGALDRLDAVLFTAVVGYYIWAAYV